MHKLNVAWNDYFRYIFGLEDSGEKVSSYCSLKFIVDHCHCLICWINVEYCVGIV